MTADPLTKALPGPAFIRHRDIMLGNALPTAPTLSTALAFMTRVTRLYAVGLLACITVASQSS
jgi:hypothetical protein